MTDKQLRDQARRFANSPNVSNIGAKMPSRPPEPASLASAMLWANKILGRKKFKTPL